MRHPGMAMPAIPSVRAWPLLLLLAVPLGAAASAPQPWQCAPCSAERLALCPPVPASCPEIARPAGCGCCPTCALPLGAACGMATARCGRGLSCRPLPGEPRPLHALARGRGACMAAPDSPAPGAEATGIATPNPGPSGTGRGRGATEARSRWGRTRPGPEGGAWKGAPPAGSRSRHPARGGSVGEARA